MELWAQNKPYIEHTQRMFILPEILILMCLSTIPICMALQVKVLLWILSFTGLKSKVAVVFDDKLARVLFSCLSSHNNSSTAITLVHFTTPGSPTTSVPIMEITNPVMQLIRLFLG